MVVGILPHCVFVLIFIIVFVLFPSLLGYLELFCFVVMFFLFFLHCLVMILFTLLVASQLLGNYCKHLSASSPAHVHVHTQDISGPVNMYISVHI